MINALLKFSIAQRWLVMCMVVVLASLGIWNYQRLLIDAIPDITNVQVQINTEAPGYSPLEVEQRVTFLVEMAIAGLPDVEETRSLSRYALSQVTVIFKDGTDIYFARNLISERLQQAKSQMPTGIEPVMGPVATGLGEIFHYVVHADANARQQSGQEFDITALRSLQDWVIRPQLLLVPDVTEINTIGGYEKQFHITPSPTKLLAYGITLPDVVTALTKNNLNVGAGYIEKNGEQYLIRVPGQINDAPSIEKIILAHKGSLPIRIGDVAEVGLGKQLRTGAAILDGEETVLGTAVMIIGGNSRTVSDAVATKLKEINKSLPKGVIAEPVYDRTILVNKTIATVQKNLLEGAILVVVVLLLMLGNMRAALLTAAVIPLSMLMLITGMVQGKVSANLMSLGALDFGLIVDGAIIIVENCMLRLAQRQHQLGRLMNREERFEVVFDAAREVFRPSLISVVVVILVNLPLLALTGVEGKMFMPMAMTVIMALIAALILSLTFVPAAIALLLTGPIEEKENIVLHRTRLVYSHLLDMVLTHRRMIIAAAILFVLLCSWLGMHLGREFIPNLDEGDIAIQTLRIPGASLTQSLEMQAQVDHAILAIPEIKHVFTRVGTSEIASDPQGPNLSDGYVMLKNSEDWPAPHRSKDEILEDLEARLDKIPGNAYEISQPIQLRVNELISGVRSDLGVKIYGDDIAQLLASGNQIASLLNTIAGAEGVKVEQVTGLPILSITPDRDVLLRYGLNISDVQETLAIATGGAEAGQIFEGDKRFDLIVRLPEKLRSDLSALERLPIPLPAGGYVPLKEVAQLNVVLGPNQISRENGKRRIVVSANVSGRDLGSFVNEVQQKIEQQIKLPTGYWINYGGTFEQMQSATERLSFLVPATLLAIFFLLMMTFGSIKDALLVFSGIPLALTGGVISLWICGIPLSITAGVGFITLSGVAVLTGVMMVSAFRDGRLQGKGINRAICDGAMLRLRPILMVALVAALGFLPMALNSGTGAEVQRPLATIVIGGILSSTLLTLLILPGLYRMAYESVIAEIG